MQPKVKRVAKGWAIYCVACSCYHTYTDEWHFNGNVIKPTFSPSLKFQLGDRCCHFNVKDGRIKYSHDCSHKYKNQDIELPSC